MDKNTIIETLKDFLDYSEHYLIDEDVYDEYAKKIIETLDQPSGISTQEISKNLGLNKAMLVRAQKEKILSKPLSIKNEMFLEQLEKFWARSWFLRPQLKRHNSKDRARLCDAPELQHNWERRVYYWYLGQPEGIKDERSQFHNFTKLPVKTVIIALHYYYPRLFKPSDIEYMEEWKKTRKQNVYQPVKVNGEWKEEKRPMPATLKRIKERVKQIRKIAQRDRSRHKNNGLSYSEILEKRGVKKTDLSGFKKTERNISYEYSTGLPDDHFAPKNTPTR